MIKLIDNRYVLPIIGIGLALVGWAVAIQLLSVDQPILINFAPKYTFPAVLRLLSDSYMWVHIGLSLQRVAVGLLCALVIGVPLGIWIGLSQRFARLTGVLFQFLRMISPLSWMPLVVMLVGIGDAPVYFLLAFSAVWPIILGTAAGVHQLNPDWLLLAKSLSATGREMIFKVILPGIMVHILNATRLAVGIIWIVLVPAEMLGVSAGLGYFVLDTRDRLAYDELMAVILLIGLLGFLLDWSLRSLHDFWAR